MSSKGKAVGMIGHVGFGRSRGLALASAFAMLATVSPAIIHGEDVGKIMDRRRTQYENLIPCVDGKKGAKQMRKDRLRKDPRTRWRV